MLLIWGRRLYGSIDGINGLGTVRTVFFHLFWIPVVPMQSVVGGYELHAIHWRSVLMAYARAVLFCFLIGFLFSIYNQLESSYSSGSVWPAVLGSLVFGGLLIASYFIARTAPPERALEILESSTVPARHRMAIRASFGIVSQEEVEEFIAAETRANERARQPGTNNPW